jgi:hypothetical protein
MIGPAARLSYSPERHVAECLRAEGKRSAKASRRS